MNVLKSCIDHWDILTLLQHAPNLGRVSKEARSALNERRVELLAAIYTRLRKRLVEEERYITMSDFDGGSEIYVHRFISTASYTEWQLQRYLIKGYLNSTPLIYPSAIPWTEDISPLTASDFGIAPNYVVESDTELCFERPNVHDFAVEARIRCEEQLAYNLCNGSIRVIGSKQSRYDTATSVEKLTTYLKISEHGVVCNRDNAISRQPRIAFKLTHRRNNISQISIINYLPTLTKLVCGELPKVLERFIPRLLPFYVSKATCSVRAILGYETAAEFNKLYDNCLNYSRTWIQSQRITYESICSTLYRYNPEDCTNVEQAASLEIYLIHFRVLRDHLKEV